MKKSIIVFIIVLGVLGGIVYVVNEVIFLGLVSVMICDLIIFVNGVVQLNQVVQLGIVQVNQMGNVVEFVMKLVDLIVQVCGNLVQKMVIIIWVFVVLDGKGFGVISGIVVDVKVLVDSVNFKVLGVVNVNVSLVDFDGVNLIIDGLKFIVKLKGGQIEGDFKFVVFFVVIYK